MHLQRHLPGGDLGVYKILRSLYTLTEFICGGRIDGAECELGRRLRLTDGAPTPPTAAECGTYGVV